MTLPSISRLTRESIPDGIPSTYLQFITQMRGIAERSGLAWDVPTDSSGRVSKVDDWDMRLLNGSHQRHRAGTGGFTVCADMQIRAREAGWPEARLPAQGALQHETQDFIKALIVSRCVKGITCDGTQAIALAARRLFSTTRAAPWDLRAEDFEAALSLGNWSEKAVVDLGIVGKLIDENLLSRFTPVRPKTTRRKASKMLTRLDERTAHEKLPDRDALFELARIVFQETPATYNDAVYFDLVKVMILTGLRIDEVRMLPLDCLDWQEHLDVVTGQPAGKVGGVSRSLRLRYFAEKQAAGAPDVLVESFQWVPERFVAELMKAVNDARALTVSARAVLRSQLRTPDRFPSSDTRTFRITTGALLDTADFLFLTIDETGRRPVGGCLPDDAPICVLGGVRIYRALGTVKGIGIFSFFQRYGKAPGCEAMSVKPHSLRHLLNTELFRLNVPDTTITHQFGRQTVAQSYEYDHRSLAERLAFVQLPPASDGIVPKGSTQELVAKMVVSGLAEQSHIGQTFQKIQAEHGEVEAFRYLVANSDGFHVTPYGFCTNSFSVNPCVRHLKCFDNCRHFAGSGIKEHRVTLTELKAKLVAMRESAAAKPANTVGRKNQIEHADRLIRGVETALATQPSQTVFPDGNDYSAPKKDFFK